jgi:hypothetical protein
MPRCPSCHSRLPLSKVFFARSPLRTAYLTSQTGVRSMACPRCHRELEPQSWVGFVSVLLVVCTGLGVGYLAKHWGFNPAVRLMVVLVCGFAAGVLVYVLLVRYRLKGTVSILSPPDASRGDDASHGH